MLLLQIALPPTRNIRPTVHAFTIARLSHNVCVCHVLQIITKYRCTTQKQTLSFPPAIFISKPVSKFMVTYPAGLPSNYIIHLILPSYLYFMLYLFPHPPPLLASYCLTSPSCHLAIYLNLPFSLLSQKYQNNLSTAHAPSVILHSSLAYNSASSPRHSQLEIYFTYF